MNNLTYERINKKKVDVITLYHANYNFGGLLQAYALPKVLKDYFIMESEQIDYLPARQEYKNEITEKRKNVLHYLYQIVFSLGIVFFGLLTKRKLNKRKQVFDSFMNEIPHSEMVYEYDSISKSLEQYQVFLCGGDQIWNNHKEEKNIKVYTLQFVPESIKK